MSTRPLLRVTSWLVGLLVSLLLLGGSPAFAHQSSEAYLSYRVDGADVEQRLDIALRDLDRDLALDAEGDGTLSWGEVRQRWPDIERLADDGADRDLGGDVAGDALSDDLEPLLGEHLGFELVAGGDADVGGHLQHLFVALPLVERLGEPEAGAGDAGERLAPAQQVLGGDDVVALGRGGVPHRGRRLPPAQAVADSARGC